MEIIGTIVTEELGIVDVIEHDGEIVMTDLMLSRLLEYATGARHVRRVVSRGNLVVKNVKDNWQFANEYEKFGYVSKAFCQAEKIYVFNYSDLRSFLAFTDNKKDLVSFITNYYKVNDVKFVGKIRREHNFFNMLQKTLNTSIIREYWIGKYRVDFYLEEYNLCIEYDEVYHEHTKAYDNKRQEYIVDKLQCKFIRVKEGMELEGIGEIFNYILSIKSVDK